MQPGLALGPLTGLTLWAVFQLVNRGEADPPSWPCVCMRFTAQTRPGIEEKSRESWDWESWNQGLGHSGGLTLI